MGEETKNQPDQSKLQTQATEQKPTIQEIDGRLQIVEKTEGRMFDLLKWGFALLMIFAGGNWWLSKSNYDRDKESLIERATALETRFQLSNQAQLANIREQTASNMTFMFAIKENQLSDNIRSNLLESGKLTFETISNYNLSVQKAILRNEGTTLYLQAYGFCKDLDVSTKTKAAFFSAGLNSYVEAATDFIEADDEYSLTKCMIQLKECVPVFLNAEGGFAYSMVEAGVFPKKIHTLIDTIENDKNLKNRYAAELYQIKSFLTLIEEKAKREKTESWLPYKPTKPTE
jgi:hypothetical protein